MTTTWVLFVSSQHLKDPDYVCREKLTKKDKLSFSSNLEQKANEYEGVKNAQKVPFAMSQCSTPKENVTK